MKDAEYPAWIDEYARSLHPAFSHMVPADWGPLDFFACWKHLNGTFIDKLHPAIVELKRRGVPLIDVAHAFPSPSSFRACIFFLFLEYQQSDHMRKVQAREVFDYLDTVLRTMFIRDAWCARENIVHTDAQIDTILDRVQPQNAAPEQARIIGRLGNAASAMSYCLYRDFWMSESFDVFGPYDVSGRFGSGHTLVIRSYPKLRPIALWPRTGDLTCNDVTLYLVYENVPMTCEFIGAHTQYQGDTIAGLRKWAIEVDGTPMTDIADAKHLMDYLGRKAVEYWAFYDGMLRDNLQEKFLEWMGYAFKPLFDMVDMDWQPTSEMRAALIGKEVPERLIMPSFPDFDEFCSSPEWEVYWLKNLYSMTSPFGR